MTPAPPAVVYEDRRLIAVSKPAGQLVIPGRGPQDEPLNRALERLSAGKVFVVHRLDKEASGLVLFAKDADTHRSLCLQFEGREVHKTYLALVAGALESDGAVERPLKEFGSGRVAVAAAGKPSLTRYRVKKRLPDATLLEVEPVTGRRHQIRVHLFSLGHPILGDPLYGSARPVGGAPRLMLHALEAVFKHEGKLLRLRAEPPDDFIAALGEAG